MHDPAFEIDHLCRDINTIAAFLAQDDFSGATIDDAALATVDVIALLGNQVIATLTAACTLSLRAPQAKLLFSGGIGHSTPLLHANLRQSPYAALAANISASLPEAEMYAIVAQSAFNIPPSRILVENRSTNSAENALFSLQAISAAGLQPQSILILQDPTMQRRSMLTWARQAQLTGSTARVLSHAAFVPRVELAPDGTLRFPLDQPVDTWTMARFLALILGEIQRLHDDEHGYGPRGKNFLPHVDIPQDVWESYLRLSAHPAAQTAIR